MVNSVVICGRRRTMVTRDKGAAAAEVIGQKIKKVSTETGGWQFSSQNFLPFTIYASEKNEYLFKSEANDACWISVSGISLSFKQGELSLSRLVEVEENKASGENPAETIEQWMADAKRAFFPILGEIELGKPESWSWTEPLEGEAKTNSVPSPATSESPTIVPHPLKAQVEAIYAEGDNTLIGMVGVGGGTRPTSPEDELTNIFPRREGDATFFSQLADAVKKSEVSGEDKKTGAGEQVKSVGQRIKNLFYSLWK